MFLSYNTLHFLCVSVSCFLTFKRKLLMHHASKSHLFFQTLTLTILFLENTRSLGVGSRTCSWEQQVKNISSNAYLHFFFFVFHLHFQIAWNVYGVSWKQLRGTFTAHLNSSNWHRKRTKLLLPLMVAPIILSWKRHLNLGCTSWEWHSPTGAGVAQI